MMKKLVIIFLILAFFTTACTGSFMLTKKVYNFHRQQQGKWMDELVFLGVVIIPIYSIASLGDAIIFNSIEFWTGQNPIQANSGEPSVKLSRNEGLEVVLTYLAENDEIRIDSYALTEEPSSIILERNELGVMAKNKDGAILYTAKSDGQGGISVYGKGDELVKHFSPRMVQTMKNQMGVQYN